MSYLRKSKEFRIYSFVDQSSKIKKYLKLRNIKKIFNREFRDLKNFRIHFMS